MTTKQRDRLKAIGKEVAESKGYTGKDTFTKKETWQFAIEVAIAFAKKQPKEKADPCYALFVDSWTKAYPILGFNGISGKCIKEMITDTREVIALGNGSQETENVHGMFEYVLAYVKRDNHWVHGKVITTFAQQYRGIITEIHQGKKNGKGFTTNTQSARDFASSL